MFTLKSSKRRVKSRGSMMLFFVVMVLPLLLLAGALAIDVTRVVAANRQMSTATNAAALAAAWSFSDPTIGTGSNIDVSKARANAEATYCKAFAEVVTTTESPTAYNPKNPNECLDEEGGQPDGVSGSDLNMRFTYAPGDKLTVSADSKLTGLVFLGFAKFLITGEPSESITIASESVAYPCNSSITGNAQAGNCARPLPKTHD